MSRRRGKKRLPLKFLIPMVIWDFTWRALAIRRAIQIGDKKQVWPLLFANSLGLWPMYYLWSKRGALPRDA